MEIGCRDSLYKMKQLDPEPKEILTASFSSTTSGLIGLSITAEEKQVNA